MRISPNPYARYVAPPASPSRPAKETDAAGSPPAPVPTASLSDLLSAEEKRFMLGQHLDVRG
jgi:hypothetical protein